MAMLSNLDLIRRVPLFSMLTQAQAESIAEPVRAALEAMARLGVHPVAARRATDAARIEPRALEEDTFGVVLDLAGQQSGNWPAGFAGCDGPTCDQAIGGLVWFESAKRAG